MSDYNYAAAFVAFTRSVPVEDIAQTFAIPITSLKNKIRTEGWARLANDYMPVATIAPRAERDIERVQANREKNLTIAAQLQDDLIAMVEALRKGELKFKKVLATGGIVEMQPTIKDRLDLAQYAKTVSEMAYRALGDAAPSGREGGDAALPPGANIINIILPAQIAAPRPERVYAGQHEALVIDLPPEVKVEEDGALSRAGSSGTSAHCSTATGCAD